MFSTLKADSTYCNSWYLICGNVIMQYHLALVTNDMYFFMFSRRESFGRCMGTLSCFSLVTATLETSRNMMRTACHCSLHRVPRCLANDFLTKACFVGGVCVEHSDLYTFFYLEPVCRWPENLEKNTSVDCLGQLGATNEKFRLFTVFPLKSMNGTL